MKKILLILSALLMLSSCFGKGVQIKLTANDVDFLAIVYDYKEQSHGGYKVSGELKIINNRSRSILFSNKDLYLVILHEGEGRAYVDSVASHVIDFATVEIKKGEILKQKVYWILPPVKSLKAERFVMEWRNWQSHDL